jgi:murein DD-endopeptidase MepM/ murein hydrolase activator NlpD
MKKILLFLLLALPVYLAASIYFLDKDYFLCPVEYRGDILVRCDSKGNGFFASSRRGRRMHQGLDLFAPVGSPVFASRSGVVTVTTDQKRGMGKYIVIRHQGGLMTLYGHLSDIYVRKYQFVRQGTLIGRVGKTGNANSPAILPHLHFEVRKNGIPQDPFDYIQ